MNQQFTVQGTLKRDIDSHAIAGEHPGEQVGVNQTLGTVVPPSPNEHPLFSCSPCLELFPILTDVQCKNAQCPPGKERARVACSGGLYLEVSPAGSKRWFWKYRKDGKEGRMALGSYPDVGPKAARQAREDAKAQKSDGRDPIMARKVEKLKAMTPSGNTFKAVGLEWHALKADGWSDSHAIREKRNFKNDLLPYFAPRSIGEIEAIELLAVIRRVEERGALESAHRVFTTAGQIWR